MAMDQSSGGRSGTRSQHDVVNDVCRRVRPGGRGAEEHHPGEEAPPPPPLTHRDRQLE